MTDLTIPKMENWEIKIYEVSFGVWGVSAKSIKGHKISKDGYLEHRVQDVINDVVEEIIKMDIKF